MTFASRRLLSSLPLREPAHHGPHSSGSASGRAVVLIVEDDTLLRMHAAEMIEEAGFHVLEAENADAAIHVLESRTDVGIVFTDIDMPGSMNGLKLAQAVADRWPPIRILATSGHFGIHDGDLPLDGQFIAKPYRAHQIINTLQALAGLARA